MAKALDIIRPRLGVKLNIRKNEIFYPSCDVSKLHRDLFPSEIRRPMLGLQFIRGDVSRDRSFIKGFPWTELQGLLS